jgi:hypothetical protein
MTSKRAVELCDNRCKIMMASGGAARGMIEQWIREFAPHYRDACWRRV